MVKLPTRTAARLVAALARDRKGATAVEYGLILALVVLALMAALVGLGGTNKMSWGSVHDKVIAATNP